MLSSSYLRLHILSFNQPGHVVLSYLLFEKIPCVSGPMQFKFMLFKGKLYIQLLFKNWYYKNAWSIRALIEAQCDWGKGVWEKIKRPHCWQNVGICTLCVCVYVCVRMRTSHVQLFETTWTVIWNAPLSMEFSMARILEWVAKSSSRKSSWSRDRTWVSCIAGRFFTIWAPREAQTMC